MRSITALRIYVSLFLAAVSEPAARGDFNWNEAHSQALHAFQNNQFETTENLLRIALDEASLPEQRATASNDLGVLLHLRGRDKEAKALLSQAMAQWQQLGHKTSAARTAHSLGTVLRTLGDYAEAETIMREALTTQPADPKDFALLANTLADLLREQGHFAEARNFAHMTLQTPQLPWRITIDAIVTLADMDREARQFQASLDGWGRALTESRTHNDSLLEAVALRGLGQAYLMMGDRASATPAFRKALAYFEAVDNKHQIASTLTCLADLYNSEGKPALAEDALRRAVTLEETAVGPRHPQIAVMLQMRADAALRLGAFARARADLDLAWNILRSQFGEQSQVAGAFLTNRGILEEKLGDNQAAANDFEKATAILRASDPETLQVRTVLLEHYAGVLRTLQRKDQAKAVLVEAKGLRSAEGKSFRR